VWKRSIRFRTEAGCAEKPPGTISIPCLTRVIRQEIQFSGGPRFLPPTPIGLMQVYQKRGAIASSSGVVHQGTTFRADYNIEIGMAYIAACVRQKVRAGIRGSRR